MDDQRQRAEEQEHAPHCRFETDAAAPEARRASAPVASALASGLTYPPALFVNGERYPGELDPAAVTAALEVAAPGRDGHRDVVRRLLPEPPR